jgi:arsenate reductase-like glutaredoxin family protein
MDNIITWIENNTIKYEKINNIVKQKHEGITANELVKMYNLHEGTKENNQKNTDPMTIETFNYIIKTVERAPNTFYNVLKIIYNEKTKRWITKNESYIEEINILKEENKQLKESMKKFTSTTAEDW